jgi:hypothetical protein
MTFYVWRRKGHHIKATQPGTGARLPRKKHATQEAAETEARRLSALFPDSRFLVLAVVAEVTGQGEVA